MKRRIIIKKTALFYIKYPVYAVALFWISSLFSFIYAQKFEIGVTGSMGTRQPGMFDKGVKRFQSEPQIRMPRYNAGDTGRLQQSVELDIRSGDALDDPRHWIGLSIGTYSSPDIYVNEFSQRSLLKSDWEIYTPYTLLHYHYRNRFDHRMFRKWEWEFGAGYGFVHSALWKVKGYRIPWNQDQNPQIFTSRMHARYGAMVRFDAATTPPIFTPPFFLRTGIRFTYMRIQDFHGKINRSDGEWYKLGNGGFLSVSNQNFFAPSFQAQTSDSIRGDYSVSVIQERVQFDFSHVEWTLSGGVRF